MTDSNKLADNDIKDFDEPSRYVLDNYKVGQLGWIAIDVCCDCLGKLDGKSNLKQKLISSEDRRVTSTQDR